MEKQAYTETPIVGQAEVDVKPAQKIINFKTKVRYLNINRTVETIVSIDAPQITQAGILQFLLADRLISIPLQVIERWEIERLDEVTPARLDVKVTEKQ